MKKRSILTTCSFQGRERPHREHVCIKRNFNSCFLHYRKLSVNFSGDFFLSNFQMCKILLEHSICHDLYSIENMYLVYLIYHQSVSIKRTTSLSSSSPGPSFLISLASSSMNYLPSFKWPSKFYALTNNMFLHPCFSLTTFFFNLLLNR